MVDALIHNTYGGHNDNLFLFALIYTARDEKEIEISRDGIFPYSDPISHFATVSASDRVANQTNSEPIEAELARCIS